MKVLLFIGSKFHQAMGFLFIHKVVNYKTYMKSTNIMWLFLDRVVRSTKQEGTDESIRS